MFAGIRAAQRGMRVQIFEQNEKLGKKLFITGKGRCNFTNACTEEELLEHTVTNPKFLYSAYYGCNSWDMIDFFEGIGVPAKVERGTGRFRLQTILLILSGGWSGNLEDWEYRFIWERRWKACRSGMER